MKISVLGWIFESTNEAFVCNSPFGVLQLIPIPQDNGDTVWELKHQIIALRSHAFVLVPCVGVSPVECMLRLQRQIAMDIAYQRAEWFADNLIDPQAQTIENVKNMRDYSRVNFGKYCEQVSFIDVRHLLTERNLWVLSSRVDEGTWE